MNMMKSYAKINLFLDVIRLYKNGYHGLRSLFAETDLADEIRFEKNSLGKIRVIDPDHIIPEDNLLTKAASHYEKFCGSLKTGLDFHLLKKIPIGGGMGGGSSNAAAVLKILNRLNGNRCSLKQLEKIGGRIGSDIPFFIRGGIQKVFGTGQLLTPLIITSFEIPALIVVPDQKMETPKAYRLIDEKKLCRDTYDSRKRFKILLEGFKTQSLEKVASGLTNLFESVVFPEIPELQTISEAILGTGALKSLMSGSGSTMIGIYPDQAALNKACQKLAEQYLTYQIRIRFQS